MLYIHGKKRAFVESLALWIHPYSYLATGTIVHYARIMPKYRWIFCETLKSDKRVSDKTFQAIFSHFPAVYKFQK